MTGRIVVGIDGSPQSGKALDWAVARAYLGGEELELLHAYSFTPPVDFFGLPRVAAGQQVAWLMGLSEELLAAAAAHVRELAPELTCTSTSLSLPQQARSSWVSMTRRSARMRFVTVGRSRTMPTDRSPSSIFRTADSRRARRVRHGVGGRVDPISAGVGPAGLEPTTPAV